MSQHARSGFLVFSGMYQVFSTSFSVDIIAHYRKKQHCIEGKERNCCRYDRMTGAQGEDGGVFSALDRKVA